MLKLRQAWGLYFVPRRHTVVTPKFLVVWRSSVRSSYEQCDTAYPASDDGFVSLDRCNGRNCNLRVLLGETDHVHRLRIVNSRDRLRPHWLRHTARRVEARK